MKRLGSFDSLAEYYDVVYQDKDYEKETDFIERCFREFSESPPRKLLEIGCGTGNFTRIFVKNGYNVTGVDFSERMLKIARQKVSTNLVKSDVKALSLNSTFDSCLALFTVLGYLNKNSDVLDGLKAIRKHLRINGLFVFDVWNGLALMRILPECRLKEMENDKLKVIRFAAPTLRAFEHICEVDYTVFVHKKATGSLSEFRETHAVRFFFPQELKFFLEIAGFEVLRICPLLDLEGTVDESVWTMTVIAKAT